MSQTVHTSRTRTWRLAGFPIEGLLVFVAALWVAFFALAEVLTLGIATWGEVESSVWEQASELIRFFVMFIALWLVHSMLGVYVAHGVTRREFMAKATMFVAVLAGLLAVLTALGYLLERLVFEVADWPQALTDEHLFASPRDYAAIVLAYWLVYAVWGAVGLFATAGFYRDEGAWGLVAVPVGVALILPTELAVGAGSLPFVGRAIPTEDVRAVLAVALCLVAATAALAGAWLLIRDMPIRNRRA
jgi:hypothetical protein